MKFPRLMCRCLINVVSNSAKFTEPGGLIILHVFPLSTAAAAADDEGGRAGRTMRVAFEVSDTGVGVAESHLRSMFQPFSQV